MLFLMSWLLVLFPFLCHCSLLSSFMLGFWKTPPKTFNFKSDSRSWLSGEWFHTFPRTFRTLFRVRCLHKNVRKWLYDFSVRLVLSSLFGGYSPLPPSSECCLESRRRHPAKWSSSFLVRRKLKVRGWNLPKGLANKAAVECFLAVKRRLLPWKIQKGYIPVVRQEGFKLWKVMLKSMAHDPLVGVDWEAVSDWGWLEWAKWRGSTQSFLEGTMTEFGYISAEYMLFFQFISFCLYTLFHINLCCGHSLLTTTKNTGTAIGTYPSSYKLLCHPFVTTRTRGDLAA